MKSSHLNKCLPIWHPLPPKNEALLPLKNKAPLLRIDYWGKIPNIKNYYCFNFFICYLTAPWPTWDNYHSNSLTCPLLITVLLSIFDPKRAPMLSLCIDSSLPFPPHFIEPHLLGGAARMFSTFMGNLGASLCPSNSKGFSCLEWCQGHALQYRSALCCSHKCNVSPNFLYLFLSLSYFESPKTKLEHTRN